MNAVLLVIKKALFRQICGIDKNNFEDFFHTPWRIWIVLYRPKSNLHYKESPYLIFLKVVEFLFSRPTRFFAVVWRGGRTSEIRGITHRLPRTRSTPKPHVRKVIWGVLSLFLTSALPEMVVFVLHLHLDRSALGHRKARFRPVRGIDKNNSQEIFHAQWRIEGASIDQNRTCI